VEFSAGVPAGERLAAVVVSGVKAGAAVVVSGVKAGAAVVVSGVKAGAAVVVSGVRVGVAVRVFPMFFTDTGASGVNIGRLFRLLIMATFYSRPFDINKNRQFNNQIVKYDYQN